MRVCVCVWVFVQLTVSINFLQSCMRNELGDNVVFTVSIQISQLNPAEARWVTSLNCTSLVKGIEGIAICGGRIEGLLNPTNYSIKLIPYSYTEVRCHFVSGRLLEERKFYLVHKDRNLSQTILLFKGKTPTLKNNTLLKLCVF